MLQRMIQLEENTGTPLYAQIYEHIKGEIKAGEIPAYTRLPSTRKLAEMLGVSRSTVQLAYDQLLAEGYLDAEPCRGYYAADVESMLLAGETKGSVSGAVQREDSTGLNATECRLKEVDSERRPGAVTSEEQHLPCHFSLSGVDLAHFPYNTWRKLTREVFSDESGNILSKGDTQGEPKLRQAVCEYLHGARGVKCGPEQVIVGAGNEYLLMLLAQIIEGPRRVAMEEVTYLQAGRVFNALGWQVFSARMDGQGICVDALEQQKAGLAYVMPSHQFPTGIVMPITRRLELLSWAERTGSYLIEDDYDSEFRYHGRPIPALQSVDRSGRVIYMGTFSRAIAPAIRVSYLVLPEQLLKRYRSLCSFYACTVPRADQAVLTGFLTDGHFERHLNRMRAIYRSRHDCLLEALEPLRRDFRIYGENAGVHLLLQDLHGRSEEELCRLAAAGGVWVHGISEYRLKQEEKEKNTENMPPQIYDGAVLLGFAGLMEGQLRSGAEALVRAWMFTKN